MQRHSQRNWQKNCLKKFVIPTASRFSEFRTRGRGFDESQKPLCCREKAHRNFQQFWFGIAFED
jgi:hypothetical protein